MGRFYVATPRLIITEQHIMTGTYGRAGGGDERYNDAMHHSIA
jgi:hypothetical protein